jgi:recombination protein RecA
LEESLKAESLIAKDQFLPALIVWDSVAATTSQAASDKVEKEGLDAYNVASQARQLSALFRDGQLSSKLNRAGITLFVINQQREKIGVLWGDNKVTFGGKALEYYTSARIELKERAPLVLNKEQVGVMVRSKVTKSKVGSPFGEARLCILFNKGIHNSLTTFYTLDDLGAIGTSGSWLVLKLGDEEYKFRRSEFDTVINDHYTEVIELLKTYGPNRKGVEIPEAVVEEEDDSYTD